MISNDWRQIDYSALAANMADDRNRTIRRTGKLEDHRIENPLIEETHSVHKDPLIFHFFLHSSLVASAEPVELADSALRGCPITSSKCTHQISRPPKPPSRTESKRKILRSGVHAGQRSSPDPLMSGPRLTNLPHVPSALRVVT